MSKASVAADVALIEKHLSWWWQHLDGVEETAESCGCNFCKASIADIRKTLAGARRASNAVARLKRLALEAGAWK